MKVHFADTQINVNLSKRLLTWVTINQGKPGVFNLISMM